MKVIQYFKDMRECLLGHNSYEALGENSEVRSTEFHFTPSYYERSIARITKDLGPERVTALLKGATPRAPARKSGAKWHIHCCLLDPDCLKYYAPPRMTIRTPWRFISIAIGAKGKTHKGLTDKEYLNGYIHVAWHRNQICNNITHFKYLSPDKIFSYSTCPLLLTHDGPCYDWFEENYTYESHGTLFIPSKEEDLDANS